MDKEKMVSRKTTLVGAGNFFHIQPVKAEECDKRCISVGWLHEDLLVCEHFRGCASDLGVLEVFCADVDQS